MNNSCGLSENLEPSLVIASKLDLRYPIDGPTRQLLVNLPALTSLKFPFHLAKAICQAKAVPVLFVSIPGQGELLLSFLVKAIYRSRISTVVFDLIMRNPHSVRERLLAPIKRHLLRYIDIFIFIHRDTSGYESAYGIPKKKCVYVPFKANNFDIAPSVPTADGGYVVALGASQRDYGLLMEAVRDLPIPVKIVAPRSKIGVHGANMGIGPLPPNFEWIDRPVDRIEWNTLIAQSRFVAIPIRPGTLQPAGISVYLEAMMLDKPVVITRSTSTEGILDERTALIVPPGDAGALRKAITYLWNDAGLRERLAKNGKRYAISLGNNDRLLADLRSIIRRTYARTAAPSSQQ